MTQPDHVDHYLRSLGPAVPPQRRISVSPRVRTPEPLPIDWRRAARTIRLAVGTVICALIGHDWRWRMVVQSVWVPQARRHISAHTANRRRRCNRCAMEQTRIVGGKWRKSA